MILKLKLIPFIMRSPSTAKMWSLHYFICSLLLSLVTSQDSDFISKVNFIINEELPSETSIGNVAAEANFGTNNGYTFTMLSSANTPTLISLDSTTGELKTAKIIDREKDCTKPTRCEYLYEVSVQKDTFFQIITVNLTIIDINDNTPTFNPNEVTLDLSESTSLNEEIPISEAIDIDKGIDNGIANFSFSSFSTQTDNFELVIGRNPVGSFGVSIKLVKELDYEEKQNYELLIVARDAGIPIRTGTLTVNINVLDENDNKPIFDEDNIKIKVTEDIAIGKVIVRLKATDKDSGENGDIVYSLAKQQTGDIFDYFTIDADTGDLKVKENLVYEPGNSEKTIYIVATDKAEPPKSAQATVHLTIEDAGNNPPTITLTFLAPETSPGSKVISVSENASVEEVVVHVNVEDTDTGANGNVSCHTYNTYFGLMKYKDTIGYTIYVQRSLDRELIDSHNVTIICIDGGGDEATDNFLVQVKDENDNTPKFKRPYYSSIMKENNTYGATVVKVSATDDDIDENGRISYIIHPDDANNFEAEEFTGVIRAKIILDRESYQDVVFKVLAVDHGKKPRTSTATIQVAVEDINDMVPIFIGNNPDYNFKVQERLVSGSYVDQVTAIDEDQGDNKKVEYNLLPEYLPNENLAVPFTIMEDGKIYTNTELDREEIGSYRFKVGVHDFGKPQRNNTVWVNVKVVDFNDEAPRFIFPSSANKNNSIEAFNEVSEVPIATVFGEDNDEGINKELIYFIVSGNNEDIFSLDSNSGNLFIVKYVHVTSDQLFTLELSVYDKGQQPLFSKETLYVTLKYSNASHASMQGEEDSKGYIAIVVAVVVITVVLSTTIIVVICLIRRKDLSKCGGDSKPPYIQTDHGLKGGSSPHLSSDKVYPEALQQRNKKEVSFSLDEGDSMGSSEFKTLTLKDKKGQIGRPSKLGDMPEENLSSSSPQVNSMLHPANRYGNPQAKFLEQPDVQLTVGHHREDSHSETSGETTTSHDSGRGSVEGDNHDFKFDINPLNSSAYLIREDPVQSAHRNNKALKPKDIPPQVPIKTQEVKRPSVLFNGNNQTRTKNWCQNLDSTGSYPDSDYLSMGSAHNYSHTNSYPEHGFPMNTYSHNQKLSPLGYRNLAYGNTYPTYRSNSTRDDDETTTTSGSYTINHEDLDDDVAQTQYQVSQMV